MLLLLSRKLENHRRRARRAAMRECADVTSTGTARWERFSRWLHFNPVRVEVRNQIPLSKRIWAEQRSGLEQLIALTLERRCYAPLQSEEMKRVVRLLKEEFRRGRHSLLLREVLSGGEEQHGNLLFGLLKKKLTLTPLPGATLSRAEEMAEVGERLKAWSQRPRNSGLR